MSEVLLVVSNHKTQPEMKTRSDYIYCLAQSIMNEWKSKHQFSMQ